MQIYVSRVKEIKVFGMWDGEDEGPLLDELREAGYLIKVQVRKEPKQTEEEIAEWGKDPGKILYVVGDGAYDNIHVGPGSYIALQENGRLWNMDAGYFQEEWQPKQ